MYFATRGPPSSPPIALLLRRRRMMIAIAASEQKIVTEKAKLEWIQKLINETKNLTFFLTFPMELQMAVHGMRGKQLPLSMRCRYPGKHWRRYCPSRCRHSHPHICPEWLPPYLRTYLRGWKQVRNRIDGGSSAALPGILVPRATNTMAVTESLIPNVQPKCDATSPMIAVTIPMQRMETTKHKYPPATSVILAEKWKNEKMFTKIWTFKRFAFSELAGE